MIVIFSCVIILFRFFFPWLSVHLVALTTAKYCNNSISGQLRITQPQQHSKRANEERGRKKPCIDKFVPLTLHCTWLHFSCTCKWVALRTFFFVHFVGRRCCCCLLLISSSLTTMVFWLWCQCIAYEIRHKSNTYTVIDMFLYRKFICLWANFCHYDFFLSFSLAFFRLLFCICARKYTCKFSLVICLSFLKFHFWYPEMHVWLEFYLCHRINILSRLQKTKQSKTKRSKWSQPRQ